MDTTYRPCCSTGTVTLIEELERKHELLIPLAPVTKQSDIHLPSPRSMPVISIPS